MKLFEAFVRQIAHEEAQRAVQRERERRWSVELTVERERRLEATIKDLRRRLAERETRDA